MRHAVTRWTFPAIGSVHFDVDSSTALTSTRAATTTTTPVPGYYSVPNYKRGFCYCNYKDDVSAAKFSSDVKPDKDTHSVHQTETRTLEASSSVQNSKNWY